MRLVAQAFGLGDSENALVDPTRDEIRQCLRRKRGSRRCWCPHCPFGLAPFPPEVVSQKVLPTAIVAGRPWNRGRVVRMEAEPGIGRHGDGHWMRCGQGLLGCCGLAAPVELKPEGLSKGG